MVLHPSLPRQRKIWIGTVALPSRDCTPALRGQFITQLGRSGVSLVEAQKLARHCDPKLTANHYTHLSLHDLASAVSRLVAPRTTDRGREAMRATGSDEILAKPLSPNW